ncbi:hypothetical protein H6G96_38095 [Nostoc sp. FACHB-892]|uniref:hypothetical protein n=1 Tax=Nostoc sp. FACHB-892 TaxID=2692843 RepID=UPI001686A92D|nr:hypothetical protein [Nostoc sp. FACHB-892]MBD2731924.1 hypothetical protein [Nostoc sp. FACHB-892]
MSVALFRSLVSTSEILETTASISLWEGSNFTTAAPSLHTLVLATVLILLFI